MYYVRVEHEFRAGHQVRMPNGLTEQPHEHNWRIIAELGREMLDKDGFVVDFQAVKGWLTEIGRSLGGKKLINEQLYFNGINPTTENISIYIYEQMMKIIPPGIRLVSVTLFEAPGCCAIYRPDITE